MKRQRMKYFIIISFIIFFITLIGNILPQVQYPIIIFLLFSSPLLLQSNGAVPALIFDLIFPDGDSSSAKNIKKVYKFILKLPSFVIQEVYKFF